MRTIETGLRSGICFEPIDIGDAGAALIVEHGQTIELWRGFDAARPIRSTILSTDGVPYASQVIDVDGDGRDDLVVSQPRAGTSVWLQGEGAAFERRAGFGFYSSTFELVEATGDGVLDVLLSRTMLAIGKPGQLVLCPADLDGDGQLTLFDFLEFQSFFDAGDPAADFDGDGVLTVFDFLQYQNLFDLGCP